MKNTVSSNTQERLARLPGRVQKTLSSLIEIGHIDEPTLATVLDAGEAANDHSRLSAFATSYLFLRQQGVPVGDVIHMAKQHRRKISLWWSASRWQTEHQRLSRLATLRALSSANETYDVSPFSAHLPSHFAGYLIRTSRRLGMEGLRQQHCVASWHTKLKNGLCAIAVVFVAKTRWTVELIATHNPDFPLTIGQIRKKLNGMPTHDERRAIYTELNITEKTALIGSQPENRKTHLENLRRILPLTQQLGVESVSCEFAGYGDSGQIETITIEPEAAGQNPVTIIKSQQTFADGVWLREWVETPTTLRDAIEQVVYDFLDDTQVDWYNNEGGQGSFEIDVAEQSFSLYVDVNEIRSDTAFSAEMTFAELNE